MIFQAPYPTAVYTIYLPNPSLNDIKRLTLTQDIKRNLNHEIITYIQRNTNRQFTWQFLLSLAKKWELYYFMREYNEKKMQVVDHRNRVLVGYVINANSFTHERRGDFRSNIYDNLSGSDQVTEELVSITVDFVGNFL